MTTNKHHLHDLNNEENFKRMVNILEGKERRDKLSAEKTLTYFPKLSGKTVFDGGAGTGYLTIPLARSAKKVIAFDQSEKMLSIIKDKDKEEALFNIECYSGDITNIPLADESVDLVVVSAMIHEVDNYEGALQELSRILKGDGQIMILDFESETTRHENGGCRIPSHMMKESLEKLGFPILKKALPADGMYLFMVGKIKKETR